MALKRSFNGFGLNSNTDFVQPNSAAPPLRLYIYIFTVYILYICIYVLFLFYSQQISTIIPPFVLTKNPLYALDKLT